MMKRIKKNEEHRLNWHSDTKAYLLHSLLMQELMKYRSRAKRVMIEINAVNIYTHKKRKKEGDVKKLEHFITNQINRIKKFKVE